MDELPATPPVSDRTRARTVLIALAVLIVIVVVLGVVLFRVMNSGHSASGSQTTPGAAQPMPTSANSPGGATTAP